MSWNHSITKSAPGEDHASPSEIMACFRDQRDLLMRLAWMITGNTATAEQSVAHACEMAIHGHSPFRNWLTQWAKWVTVKAAISESHDAIRGCEPAYKDLRCSHGEHLLEGNGAEGERRRSFLFQIDPSVITAELDPLARSVLILRTVLKASILDCTLRLNVSSTTVLAANCRAMTWLRDAQLRGVPAGKSGTSTETSPALSGSHEDSA